MNRRLLALTTATLLGAAESAPAFDLGLGLFKKKAETKKTEAKSDATDKQLVATLQTDLDEGRRKAAAEALRKIDPKANFDGVSALAAALLKDPSPDVRATAAESLGAFKVVYTQAAAALEKAESDDPDKGVRAAAKAALFQYALAGYKGSAAVSKGQSSEPPLAKTPKPLPTSPGAGKPATSDVLFRPISQGPVGGTLPAETSEPPLAKPAKTLPAAVEAKPQPVVAPPPGVPQKMPSVPQRMPATVEPTVNPPKVELSAPPLPKADDSKLSPLPLPEIPQPQKVPTVLPPK